MSFSNTQKYQKNSRHVTPLSTYQDGGGTGLIFEGFEATAAAAAKMA